MIILLGRPTSQHRENFSSPTRPLRLSIYSGYPEDRAEVDAQDTEAGPRAAHGVQELPEVQQGPRKHLRQCRRG